jgi:hypothetical protein
MAIHIGQEQEGTNCRLASVPWVLITGIFAWLYKTTGNYLQSNLWYKTSHNCHYFRSYFSSGKILKTVQLGIIGGVFFALLQFNEIILLFWRSS